MKNVIINIYINEGLFIYHVYSTYYSDFLTLLLDSIAPIKDTAISKMNVGSFFFEKKKHDLYITNTINGVSLEGFLTKMPRIVKLYI